MCAIFILSSRFLFIISTLEQKKSILTNILRTSLHQFLRSSTLSLSDFNSMQERRVCPLQNAIGPLVTVFLQLFLILVDLLFEYGTDLREKVISLWKAYKGTNSSTIKEKMKAYPVDALWSQSTL